ncbi:MAG: hypothetical protein IPK60_17070 [Sandaracinaceae bacterium]|nr:hypothetical protein [Sandaracinaceae bacterium]
MTSAKYSWAAVVITLCCACGDEQIQEPTVDGGVDMGLMDAGADAGADLGMLDADLDEGIGDAGEVDAGHVDAGLEPRFVYTLMNQDLVKVNLDTGAHETFGDTGHTFVSFAWDNVANVARVIYDINTPSSSTAKMGTIDLCTGAITPGVTLHIGSTDLTYAEGFAQDPATGTFWLSYPTVISTTGYLTNRLGTINIETGEVTFVGTITSAQSDADTMTFVDGAIIFADVVRATPTTDVQRATAPTSGTEMTQTRIILAPTDAITRIAYDANNDQVLVLNAVSASMDRHVAIMNRETGETTRITPSLPATEYPGASYFAMLIAPPPVCP